MSTTARGREDGVTPGIPVPVDGSRDRSTKPFLMAFATIVVLLPGAASQARDLAVNPTSRDAGDDNAGKEYKTLDEVQSALKLEFGGLLADMSFVNVHARDFRLPADGAAVKLGCDPKGEVPGVKLGTASNSVSGSRND